MTITLETDEGADTFLIKIKEQLSSINQLPKLILIHANSKEGVYVQSYMTLDTATNLSKTALTNPQNANT